MKLSINDYGFIYIRLSLIKSLLMSDEDINKLSSFADLESLDSYTRRFFPKFVLEQKSIDNFELNLWNAYFSIIENIYIASPLYIQEFLKNYLVKYEISNIKVGVYKLIEQNNSEIEYSQLYNKPSILLERYKFLQKMLTSRNLKELLINIKNSPYYNILKDGLDKYEKTGTTFFLEHSLDKYYYTNLCNICRFFPSREKEIILAYIYLEIDYYNINLIYRTLYNGISLDIIKPFLIQKGSILKKEDLILLTKSNSNQDFIIKLQKSLAHMKQNKEISEILEDPNPESLSLLLNLFFDIFFKKYKDLFYDISTKSIYLIFFILVFKLNELKKIRARSIQISLAEHKF